jgi:hypothetical protein
MEDSKIARYDAAKPQLFGVIERLEVAIADPMRYPASENDLLLECRPLDAADRARMTLRFQRVRNLRIVQPWMTMFQIGGLRIRSVKADQLEGINYQVSEPEYESIAFVCSDFECVLSEAGSTKGP